MLGARGTEQRKGSNREPANVYEFINDRNLERGFWMSLLIKEGISNDID